MTKPDMLNTIMGNRVLKLPPALKTISSQLLHVEIDLTHHRNHVDLIKSGKCSYNCVVITIPSITAIRTIRP